MCKYFFLVLTLHFTLNAQLIDTFYGSIEVNEPVILELIESPAFQRLKSIHQYGVAYYTTHREEYTRYDHSLGVFVILRTHNASLEEQIAGLLHDISHTTFSHVGDWIFDNHSHEKDYQNTIHAHFLEKYGIATILHNYQLTVDRIMPEETLFPMLEQKNPNLCADRIDYNIQGAYYQGFINYQEALEILNDLTFIEGKWVSSKPSLMAKLTRFSLFMTLNCWGSATNYLSSEWLAKAILRAIDMALISYEDIHFGIDQLVWERLTTSQDLTIKEYMYKVMTTSSHYQFVDEAQAEMVIKSKFRGINPWICLNEMQNKTIVRLTEFDPSIHQEYEKVQEIMKKGWAISITN